MRGLIGKTLDHAFAVGIAGRGGFTRYRPRQRFTTDAATIIEAAEAKRKRKVTEERKTNGLPVHGYRAQTGTAIDRVNINKQIEEQVLRLLDAMSHSVDIDQRWLAIGRAQIEQGFMAINRSVFRPARVVLDSEASPTV